MIWDVHAGSGIRNFPHPGSGSWIQATKKTGSRIRSLIGRVHTFATHLKTMYQRKPRMYSMPTCSASDSLVTRPKARLRFPVARATWHTYDKKGLML
jgi:hypothetical protein